MTKQEEIREKQNTILNLVKAWAVIPHPYESWDAEGLLNLLSQAGVVIKVNRQLPQNKWPSGWYVSHPHFEPTHDAIEEYKEDVLKASYVAVAPLINDKHNSLA